jgi:hypothetical protein
MLKAGFCLQNDAMPRTVFWDGFIKALKNSEVFAESAADLLVPLEDTAMELNWPRYGNLESAYIRGKSHELSDENGSFHKYFGEITAFAKSNPRQNVLYVNMNPFFRVPLMLRQLKNVIVADISLAMFERDLNPNTISMPALPIVFSRSDLPTGMRPILASFQGRIDTHPVRKLLKPLAEKKQKSAFLSIPFRRLKNSRHEKQHAAIVVNDVGVARHIGKLDAVNSKTDPEYEDLFLKSTFAFVPRGDALFSYRLLEAMSFGCIPIILSDGWVLPFDRIIPWEQLSLRVHADAVANLPRILANLSPDDIQSRQEKVVEIYKSRLANLDLMITALISEVELLMRSRQ